MPRKSNKRSNKKKIRKMTRQKTRKQKPIIMIGCSKKKCLGNKSCSKCRPNCHCGPKCNCSHSCPGNCYLNRRIKKQKGGSGFGSGCGSCGCPIGGLPWAKIDGPGQNGGNCTDCSLMKGGNFFKQPGLIPAPIFGSAWNTLAKGLPGENGIAGDRNYLPSYASSITNDPQLQMSMSNSGYKFGGGKYNRRHHRRHIKTNKRGGFIPSELLNLGYNTIKGYTPPVNNLPYNDQFNRANTNKIL